MYFYFGVATAYGKIQMHGLTSLEPQGKRKHTIMHTPFFSRIGWLGPAGGCHKATTPGLVMMAPGFKITANLN
jgi:hypothetical protein